MSSRTGPCAGPTRTRALLATGWRCVLQSAAWPGAGAHSPQRGPLVGRVIRLVQSLLSLCFKSYSETTTHAWQCPGTQL